MAAELLTVSSRSVPSLEQVRADLAKARGRLKDAEGSHSTARDELTHLLLTAGDDSPRVVKARERRAKTTEVIEAARERIGVLEAAERSAAVREADQAQGRKLAAAENAGRAFVMAGESLEDAVKHLAAMFDRWLASGEAFRASLPDPVSGNEVSTLSYFEPVAIRRASLRLFALSGGRFRAGDVAASPFVLSQGPDLGATARETVQRALSFQRKPGKEQS